MRKLASIQKIIGIRAIPNADAIEVASVLGWHCVVKKGEFKVGDLCVYHEIDCLCPITSDYEFLAKNGIKKSYIEGKEYQGYRIKTIRLRGQISQGLCLPLSILKGKKFLTDIRDNPDYNIVEGKDVTELLGIVKYEPQIPANLSGEVKGVFPSEIPKTDETRIQAVPDILKKYQGIPFYMTEKVDGASVTIFFKEGELNVCSRNLNLKDNDNTIWKAVKSLNLTKEKLLNGKIALQGEIIGSGIQKNPLKMNGQEIRFFNAYNIELGKYLDFEEFVFLCLDLKLKTVPILDRYFLLPKTVDELITTASRKSVINNGVAEGIVLRPLKEMKDEDLGRLSFKCINPEYLLNDELEG